MAEPAKGPSQTDVQWQRRRRRRLRIAAWSFGGLLLLCALGVGAAALFFPGLYRAYTDGTDLKVRAGEPSLRFVAWEQARLPVGPVNDTPDNQAPALSPDGRTLVFARRTQDADNVKLFHTDLYISRFDGLAWSKPEPLTPLNTRKDESGPAFSLDGRALLFHSNRAGGLGGFDLYVSWFDGASWAPPFNLGPKANSEFDERDPAVGPDGKSLYFASNRPKTGVGADERKAAWQKTMVENGEVDFDIFALDDFPLPRRANPLRDQEFRKDIIRQLGGSSETEKAVVAALDYLTRTQKPDGSWEPSPVPATGFATMAYLGWGAKHNEEGPYQKPLAKAIGWLTAAVKASGGTGLFSQNMYEHGIATIALAEAYSVSRDPALRQPLEQAVGAIIKAQNATGGWRYQPTSTDADTSVLGWQVVALHSARSAGLPVPPAVFEGARKWLATAGGGTNGGLYGYSGPGPSSQAMVAEGMFCQQVMGASPAHPRQNESAQYLRTQIPAPGAAMSFYYWYYGCLSLYQHQGPVWQAWNNAIKPILLAAQVKEGPDAGSWMAADYSQLGRPGSTAMGALCLEVYYRFLPMYRLEGHGADAVERSGDRLLETPATRPAAPEPAGPLVARRVAELCSDQDDSGLSFTQRGDFVYFSSARPGGLGGFDVWRCRIRDGAILKPQNAGPQINSPVDEMHPSLASHGFEIVFSSARSGGDLVYHSIARELEPVNDYEGLAWLLRLLNNVKWWLLLMLLALAALLYLLSLFLRADRARKLSLLAKCLLLSVLLHLLLALWASAVAIGSAIGDAMGKGEVQISVDADALQGQKLTQSLREQNVVMPEVSGVASANRVAAMPVPAAGPQFAVPKSQADANFALPKVDLNVRVRPREVSRDAKPMSTVDVQTIIKPTLDIGQVSLEQRPVKPQKEAPVAAAENIAVRVVSAPRESAASGSSGKPQAIEAGGGASSAKPAAVGPAASAVSEAGGRERPSPGRAGDLGKPMDLSDATASGGVKGGAPASGSVASGIEAALEKRGGGVRGQADVKVAQAPAGGGGDSGAKRSEQAGSGTTGQASTTRPASAAGGRETADVPDSGSALAGAKVGTPAGQARPGAAAPAGSGDVNNATDVQAKFQPGAVAAVGLEARGARRGEGNVGVGTPGAGGGARLQGDSYQPASPLPYAPDVTSIGGAVHNSPIVSAKGMQGALEPAAPQVGPASLRGGAPVENLDALAQGLSGGYRGESGRPKGVKNPLRDPGKRSTDIVKMLGGGKDTEEAVIAALNYLTRTQKPDGSWDPTPPAATGFATMAYIGWGAKHNADGPYRQPLAKAVAWLVAQVKASKGTGFISQNMYEHGIATIALAEAYASSGDPALREPLEQAVGAIIKAQNAAGGWRYNPNSTDVDTSVVGWQAMALHSAAEAGLPVPEKCFEGIRKWLALVGGGTNGGLYGYSGKGPSSLAIVAEGMFVQQIMGAPPMHPRQEESAQYIRTQVPAAGAAPAFYAWYYGCLSLYQHQGPAWTAWNDAVKPNLLASQVKQGPEAGSWMTSDYGQLGRPGSTAMGALCLEVYYRFLPMYRRMGPTTSPAVPAR